MKVNILGTEYTIKTVKISECEMLQKETGLDAAVKKAKKS